jgi:hypothetical protein
MSTTVPSRRDRVLVACAIGLLAAVYVIARAWDNPALRSDLDPQMCAARVWWQGGDAYAATGPGRACDWGFAQFYPATAFVALAPLMWMPAVIARAIFCAISSFALVMALTRDGWHRLPLLASATFQSALVRAQWEPLLTAAVIYPWIGSFWVCKPNVGVVAAVGLPARKSFIAAACGGALLFVISIARDPTWPFHWLRALQSNVQTSALFPAGAIGLLALRRWREGPARTTAAFGLVPITHLPYAGSLLFLAPRTWLQSCALAIAGDLGLMVMLAGGPYPDFLSTTRFYAHWAAPAAVAVAVYSVWSRRPDAERPPHALIVFTLALGVFVLWLSFGLSGPTR